MHNFSAALVQHEGRVIIKVRGDVDGATAAEFAACLRVLATASAHVVIDVEAQLRGERKVDTGLGEGIPELVDERQFGVVELVAVLNQGAVEIIARGKAERMV